MAKFHLFFKWWSLALVKKNSPKFYTFLDGDRELQELAARSAADPNFMRQSPEFASDYQRIKQLIAKEEDAKKKNKEK